MLSIFDFVIPPHTSLQAALERMTRNHKGVLFVCDNGLHLVGVVSDGDLRRAILGNALLTSQVENHMNLDPVVSGSMEEARALLQKHNLLAVPIINLDGAISSILVQDIEKVLEIGLEVALPDSPGEDGVVAIIPARGGSKRIPRKNLALLAGKPLLAYAIETAQQVDSIQTILVSTDDVEIADVAKKHGANVPWLRPEHLSLDTTPSIEVVLHAAEWAKSQYGNQVQYSVLLEPTAPLRTPAQVSQAVDLLRASEADSVVSVCKVPHMFNPEEVLTIEKERLSPYLAGRTMDTRLLRDRQSPVYVQNGLVYAFRLDMLLEQKSLYGEKCLPLLVDWDYFLDIDTPSDLELAEYRIRRQVG